LNEYTIVGTLDGEEVTIANMDIYYLTNPLDQDADIDPVDKIRVIYYDSPILTTVADRLMKIFDDNNMTDFFTFEAYDDIDSFEGVLLSQDYDIVLRIVDLGLRNDMRSLCVGKNPILNPSLYTSPTFITALSQYAANPGDLIANDTIITTYGNDMPFLSLGSLYDIIYTTPAIQSLIDSSSSIYAIHRNIYDTISLGSKKSIERAAIFS
jgi:hypothetical protein